MYHIILMIQGHFQGQKINLKVKITKKWYLANANKNILQMQIRTSVIRYFYMILFWFFLVFFWWFKGILKIKWQLERRMSKDMIFQQIKQIVIPRFRVIFPG